MVRKDNNVESKALIKTLEDLANKLESLNKEVTQIKIDIASNKEIVDLKIKMSVLENRMTIIYTILAAVSAASGGIIWFLFKYWIENHG